MGADPYLLYGGYGLGHYGYRTYGYPYTWGYYGKRSAEAEPEAKADPWLTYGHGLVTTTAMLDTPMPTATTDTTARGPLRPSPRPSPTTTVDTTVATPVPTTVDTDTEPTGDKYCPAPPGPSFSNNRRMLNIFFLLQ